MGQHVIVHRYSETEAGTLRVEESGSFDPDADNNPQWATDALGQRENHVEDEPRLIELASDGSEPADTIADQGAFLGDEAADEDEDAVPPKGGAGSGAQAWGKYAQANGVKLTDGMNRDEIIVACAEAGVPTE